MKRFLKIFLIIIVSVSMFTIFIEKNVYADTTTFDKEKVLSPEKQAEYDKLRNRNLKTLTVSGYDINPVFNKNTVEYYLTVSNDVTSLKVTALPENDAAKVTITGDTDLKGIENDILITVKSEKGLTKTYKIHVTKQKESSISLKTLEIEDAKFETEFSSKKYNYNIEVNQAEVEPLKIKAKANTDSANVEIIGNDSSLAVGANIITILVSKDNEVVTYQLNVKISTLREVVVNNPNNLFAGIKLGVSKIFKDTNSVIAALCAIAVILVIIIIIIVKKILKKR
ncbi:MAG: cadherin-like beta sandwich domain-containing protein [Clostridiales bacterium]|jgi:hypothetical protein|nr:cadherin-like beta sandwich domain-containing protein [Clostridiales bacterium]MBF0988260.1 cadherin-like beta sandwich domain-containing protein [Clostridiales bacterium]